MWRVLELVLFAFIGLIFITEFLIPLMTNKPMFGNFRKSKPTAPVEKKESSVSPDLVEKVKEAKAKVEEVKSVQNEVNEFFDKAKDIKNESDDMLK